MMSIKSSRRAQKLSISAVVALAFLLCPVIPAKSGGYVLARGDVLEFQVVGIPDLRQRVPVGLDGTLLLPLVGRIEAAGRTVSDVRDTIATQASQKGFPVTAGKGDVWHFVHPEAVILQVLEYRPIYLNGDVANPGEQPFRGGMTVRQAVALGGGYNLLRFKMENPVLELTDLRTQYNSTWIRLTAAQIRAARLEAELAESGDPQFTAHLDGPVPAGLVPAVQSLEMDLFSTRLDDHSKEKEAIRIALRQTETRLDLLTQRQEHEQTATREDMEEYERVKKLYDQGLTQITRLNEARRNVLLWSTRSLETSAEASRMEREHSDLERNLVRIDDQRELEILRDLQSAKLDVADLRSQLQGYAEKLVYVGALRSQLVGSDSRPRPQISIFRRTADVTERISADEDTELLPGDVVEVTVPSEWILSPALRSMAETEPAG